MKKFLGIATATALTLITASSALADNPVYDVVISGGRVMDPETGLDAIRNVGILADRIAAISSEPLHGKRVIKAKGQVVAPGFIDLHSHTNESPSVAYNAQDGVTTHLELEIGVYPVAQWYQSRTGKELINFGATVSHTGARRAAQLEDPAFESAAKAASGGKEEAYDDYISAHAIPAARYQSFLDKVAQGLEEGALGLGSGTQYALGISHLEMLDATRLAAQANSCLFTHVRYGSLVEPGTTLEALQEMVANAAFTGACVHIAHINSMAMSTTPQMLALFKAARERGLDISTEIYPWDASNDSVRSTFFDPGWEARWGVQVGDLQSKATGKRLTMDTFNALRNGDGDDRILTHMNTEETLQTALKDPSVMIISDGVDLRSRYDHPRTAGTFARVLGKYVREDKVLSLMDALRRMTLMPAQRLEVRAPAMKRKGRVQVGADADIVVFDPQTITEKAKYLDAMQASEGISAVLVNGTLVVNKGKIVPDVHPGRAVRAGR